MWPSPPAVRDAEVTRDGRVGEAGVEAGAGVQNPPGPLIEEPGQARSEGDRSNLVIYHRVFQGRVASWHGTTARNGGQAVPY